MDLLIKEFLSSVVESSSGVRAASQSDVRVLAFDAQQASQLHRLSSAIAKQGGPQHTGTRGRIAAAASELKLAFSSDQLNMLNGFSDGRTAALVVEGLLPCSAETPPVALPSLEELESHDDVLCLGVRNQLLLSLVDHQAFAYDIDNHAKIVRVVANFKGGGHTPLEREPERAEQSSHSGLSLGPHTEAPYWCAIRSHEGHSPSPSALILSALWNPGHEPTSVIAVSPILNALGIDRCLALTAPWFQFTRSDSFVVGKGEDGKSVSLLTFDGHGGFAVRFNSYRFSVMEEAPTFVKDAYRTFCRAVDESTLFQRALTQRSAIIINNTRTLHCRDVVKDNRRALVRLFGYSRHAEWISYSEDPLLVRG